MLENPKGSSGSPISSQSPKSKVEDGGSWDSTRETRSLTWRVSCSRAVTRARMSADVTGVELLLIQRVGGKSRPTWPAQRSRRSRAWERGWTKSRNPKDVKAKHQTTGQPKKETSHERKGRRTPTVCRTSQRQRQVTED